MCVYIYMYIYIHIIKIVRKYRCQKSIIRENELDFTKTCYTFDRRQMNKLKIKRIKRQKIEYRGEPCRRKGGGLCGYKKARYRFRVPYLSGSIVLYHENILETFMDQRILTAITVGGVCARFRWIVFILFFFVLFFNV